MFDRCSIAGTLDALGDEWSVLVLRELFFGVRRFNDIQHDLGISRSVLTERLARLVEVGVVKVVPYRDPGQRERHEYRLTRAGVGLLPAMIALMQWGDQHVNGGVGPVDLEIRRHECVGIAGLEGSGKADFARALAGLLPRAGTLTVGGREVVPGSVPAALAAGVGFVPEDRTEDGMVPALDVSENATMTAATRLGRRLAAGLPRVLRRAQRDELYQGLAETWQIKASSPRQTIAELSGGNQQKCVMARALATQPDLLVLVNPTAGIDVSAKASIVGTLGHVLDDGASVLVVSEDPDDFVLCDRVLVMFKGRISTELQSGWSEQELVAAMQGAEQ